MNYSETAMNLKIFTQGKNKKANKSGWNLTIFSSDSTKKNFSKSTSTKSEENGGKYSASRDRENLISEIDGVRGLLDRAAIHTSPAQSYSHSLSYVKPIKIQTCTPKLT